MKTGRLLKFHRRQADVHAYLYQDGEQYKAALYVRGKDARHDARPELELVGGSGHELEDAVRAWVEERFPR